MELIATIRNPQNGLTFRMRLVGKGDAYGRDNCLVHKGDDPLVEFYDVAHMHDVSPGGAPLGQFVSRYYASTLRESRSVSGLCLDGGVRDWYLDAEAFKLALSILRNWTGR
jgi:hypothetical protein